jgi:hypothetical protein
MICSGVLVMLRWIIACIDAALNQNAYRSETTRVIDELLTTMVAILLRKIWLRSILLYTVYEHSRIT